MGLLVEGEWRDEWYDTKSSGGAFKRAESRFRNWITPDGSPGPSGEGGFAAAADRYHLFVSYACPWAHRTLIFRALKGLEDLIGVSAVHPDMLGDGWSFATDFPGATGDRLFGSAFARDIYLRADPTCTGRVTVPILWDRERDTIVSNESSEIIRMFNSAFARDIYLRADPTCTGRVTVPILWDRERETIVSNESSEIIRMFNNAFDGITGNTDDYWPEDLRAGIAEVNDRIYDTVNNGVYKSGFATTQSAYDAAVVPLFESLDWLETRLSQNRYLMGDRLTEADWRLFTTLVRFDPVYHQHFKCNRARIVDYPNLWAYTRELYQWEGVASTVHFDHIVRHYHYSHDSINPNRILPINPVIDWHAPHNRG